MIVRNKVEYSEEKGKYSDIDEDQHIGEDRNMDIFMNMNEAKDAAGDFVDNLGMKWVEPYVFIYLFIFHYHLQPQGYGKFTEKNRKLNIILRFLWALS